MHTMSSMRTMLTSIGLVGVVCVGYGMWAIISPGEERKREMLKVLKHCSFINEKHKPVIISLHECGVMFLRLVAGNDSCHCLSTISFIMNVVVQGFTRSLISELI